MRAQLKVRSVARTCPYCRSALAGDIWRCARCATAHHKECFLENRRCTAFGCGSLDSVERLAERREASALTAYGCLVVVASLLGVTAFFLPTILAFTSCHGERAMAMAGMVQIAHIGVALAASARYVAAQNAPRRR